MKMSRGNFSMFFTSLLFLMVYFHNFAIAQSNSAIINFEDAQRIPQKVIHLQLISPDSFPGTIGNLVNLKRLEAIGDGASKISSIPKEVGSLLSLEEIKWVQVGLDSLPDELGLLSKLTHLDLTANHLKTIPASVSNLERLKTIGLSANSNMDFNEVFERLKKLPGLTKLALYDCDLAQIDSGTGDLSHIESLDLHDNNLSDLPAAFRKLKELRNLDISSNNFKKIPHVLYDLAQLTELKLISNPISTIPAEISKLKKLEQLAIGGEKVLEKLPSEVYRLPKLKALRIIYSKLSSLPEVNTENSKLQKIVLLQNAELDLKDAFEKLAKLALLEELVVEDESLTEFPENLELLQSLVSLSLTCPKVREVRGIEKLKDLQEIYISLHDSTDYEILFECFSKLKHLKKLSISCKSSLSMPENLDMLSQIEAISFFITGSSRFFIPSDIAKLNSLKSLAVSHPDFGLVAFESVDLPPMIKEIVVKSDNIVLPVDSFFHAPTLEKIFLKNHNCVHIPEASFSKMNKLKYLNLAGGEIWQLPNSLGDLEQLETLILSKNNLIGLPPTTNYLNNLQSLILYENQIEYLPKTLSGLEKLEKIDVRNNQLKEISDDLFRLPNLKTIWLGHNEIGFFPKKLSKSIILIDISNNKIKKLPIRQLNKAQNLEFCYFYHNPMENNEEYLKKLQCFVGPVRFYFETE